MNLLKHRFESKGIVLEFILIRIQTINHILVLILICGEVMTVDNFLMEQNLVLFPMGDYIMGPIV